MLDNYTNGEQLNNTTHYWYDTSDGQWKTGKHTQEVYPDKNDVIFR